MGAFDELKENYDIAEVRMLFLSNAKIEKGEGILKMFDKLLLTQSIVYVDEKELIAPTVMFDYDFSQRHILLVSNYCTVQDEIKIIFKTKEQADGFKEICFSNSVEF